MPVRIENHHRLLGDGTYVIERAVSTLRAAAIVASMSLSGWAAETNGVSNWLHGKYTPQSIMPQTNCA